jgi:hypothetical protein
LTPLPRQGTLCWATVHPPFGPYTTSTVADVPADPDARPWAAKVISQGSYHGAIPSFGDSFVFELVGSLLVGVGQPSTKDGIDLVRIDDRNK